jgi:hypothetical protein
MSCYATWRKTGSDKSEKPMFFKDRIELLAFMKSDGVEVTMSENNKNDNTKWRKEK